MDIAYLLWLQGIREALPGFVEQFFVMVSNIAASPALIVLPCLLYWCLDKRAGQFVLLSFSMSSIFNQLVKNTVCCYRPWIRSSDIHPAADALPGATGYSFPSGHTQSATTLFGATGLHYRKRFGWLNIACWVFVLLVAFSRNFLGVHTPQDVVVALLEGILFIALAQWLMVWTDAKEGRDVLVCIASLVATVAYVAFIMFKPYPMDYSATGDLLVNPIDMQIDCFKTGGVFAGAMLGWCLERHFLKFEADLSLGWKRLAVRLLIGIVIVAVCFFIAQPLKSMGGDERLYQLVKHFFVLLGAAFLAPAAFCAVERRKA